MAVQNNKQSEVCHCVSLDDSFSFALCQLLSSPLEVVGVTTLRQSCVQLKWQYAKDQAWRFYVRNMHIKSGSYRTFSTVVSCSYQLAWTAKDLLILEQTVNCRFVLALGNSGWRFAFKQEKMALSGQLSIHCAPMKSCIQNMPFALSI